MAAYFFEKYFTIYVDKWITIYHPIFANGDKLAP